MNRINVRVDPETMAAITRYAEANSLTTSQAARVLFAIALRDAAADTNTVAHTQAVREGFLAGETAFRAMARETLGRSIT